MMTVSVCVIAYNEESTLKGLLAGIVKQDYPHDRMEIVLIDSASEDGTKALMQSFQAQYEKEFLAVQVLDNPKKTLPCGWNIALEHFTADVILRVDAHAEIPENFVRLNMEALEQGEDVTGGYRPNVIVGETPFSKLLLLAESSMFGSSFASYRRQQKKSYTTSLFHAAYRRQVFAKIGGYNENLARTEDNEIHYRMRKAGFRLCFDPQIVSYQHTRPTLKRMLRQKYANGYWIGLTSGVCPGCLSLFHFVPLCFVLAILGTTLLAVFGYPFLSLLMWGLYGIGAVLMSVAAVFHEKKHPGQLLLPFLFLLLHVAYGAGTLVGMVKMPFWRKTHKECSRIMEIKEHLNHESGI